MPLPKEAIRDILDAVDAKVMIIRRDKIILSNKELQSWFSMSASTLETCSFLDFVLPASRRQIYEVYLRNIANHTQADVFFDVTILHPSLGTVLVKVRVQPAHYLDDKHWTVTIIPVEHATLKDNMEAHGLQLEKQVDVVANRSVLRDVISENQFIDNALDNFLTALHNIVPYDSASIALIQNHSYNFVAARGFPKSITLDSLSRNANENFPPTKISKILTMDGVWIINDVRENPDWVNIDEVTHVRSWMGVSLIHEGEQLGVLYLDSKKPHFFNDEHVRYVGALSQQAVLALVYTKLYKQVYYDVQERKRLQQILVKNLINTETMYAAQELLFSSEVLRDCLPDLLSIVSSSLENTRLILIAFDLDANTVSHKIQIPEQSDDIWSIFKQIVGEKSLAENNVPRMKVNLPIDGISTLEDGRQVLAAIVNQQGVLAAIREADEVPFTETEHELITTIATQITIALENEMLYEQLQQHSQHLERIVERRTEQLSVERQRLQAILDSTAEGIFYMENFRIQYANPAFCHMVGYGLEDLYGKPLSYIRITQETQETYNFDSLLSNPISIELGRNETRLRHADGTEFYADIRFSLAGKPGEEPVRMVAIARDISQERELYFQRARFIANAAHELRNPLSSLVLRLHMLRRQPEKMDVHLTNLDNVTNYLRELVEELLTLSRFERGAIALDKGNVILQKLIEQASNEHLPFAEEQEVTIELDMPDDAIEAHVDGKRVIQMMSNLVVNAINYSNKGGHVSVKVRTNVDVLDNRNAIITVIDDGVGIEPELLPTDIFEPFARPSQGTRKETGMGLAVVREIVHLHSGTIHAQSIVNEGSTFRVVLPID